MCHHGYKPEYCAKCLIAGVIPPVDKYKGTGNAGGCSSPYIYIQPEWKPEIKEEIFDDIDEEEIPREAVEVLIPETRPLRAKPLLENKIPIPELCPHSGIIVGGITYCGHCQKDTTGAIGAHIMLTDLMQICKQEGRRKFYYRVSNEDQVQTAFEAVWSKLSKIMVANNPPALARTIARQAVSDLRKKADNWKLIPVSNGSGGSDYRDDSGGNNGWLESASGMGEGMLQVSARKNGEPIFMPIHKGLAPLLRAEKARRNPSENETVLVSPDNGKPYDINGKRLYARLMALGKRVGINKVRPHRFRCNFAVDALLKGANVNQIAEWLGDTTETVAKHYLPISTAMSESTRNILDRDDAGIDALKALSPTDKITQLKSNAA